MVNAIGQRNETNAWLGCAISPRMLNDVVITSVDLCPAYPVTAYESVDTP